MKLILRGRTVGITAERRSSQQQRFLEARGATVQLAPVLTTVDHSERPELLRATAAMLASPPDLLVVQTGQGLRWWLSALPGEEAEKLIVSLSSTEIWCRGIKATSACRKAGLTVNWQSALETTADVTAHLASCDLTGKHVVIQIDGNDPDLLLRSASDAAVLTPLDVYGYRLPTDPQPALRLVEGVIDGTVDAVTFTASPAIRHLREIASAAYKCEALDQAFNRNCVAAVVGPVCAATATEAGWRNVIEPPRARLVPMLESLAQTLVR